MIISVARMRKGDASRLEARRLSFQLIFADRICLGKVSLKRLLSSGIQRRLLWPLCPRAPLLLCSSTPPHPTPIPPLLPLAVPGTRTSQSARSKNLICLLERECIGPIGQMAFQRRSSRDLPLLSFFFLPLFTPSPPLLSPFDSLPIGDRPLLSLTSRPRGKNVHDLSAITAITLYFLLIRVNFEI
jgi:hypothetical protein